MKYVICLVPFSSSFLTLSLARESRVPSRVGPRVCPRPSCLVHVLSVFLSCHVFASSLSCLVMSRPVSSHPCFSAPRLAIMDGYSGTHTCVIVCFYFWGCRCGEVVFLDCLEWVWLRGYLRLFPDRIRNGFLLDSA